MRDHAYLSTIRRRHDITDRSEWVATADPRIIHVDRGILLAEVDRLTAENDVLRTEIANITASKRAQS